MNDREAHLLRIIDRLEIALTHGTQYMPTDHQVTLADARAELVAAGLRPLTRPADWHDRIDMFEGTRTHR